MASRALAVDKVLLNWFGLVSHLSSINGRGNDDFDAGTKKTAEDHVYVLTTKSFLSTMCYLSDVLSIFSEFSVTTQRQYSTIIDQKFHCVFLS